VFETRLAASAYDLIVIGSGPAGRRAAIQRQARQSGCWSSSAAGGWRSVGAHRHHPFQDPPRDGAEPFRLARAGLLRPQLPGQAGHLRGGSAEAPAHDSRPRGGDLELQFSRNGVETGARGGRFIDANRIEILADNATSTPPAADRFIIAVGTRPYRPSHIAFDGQVVLDSDEILEPPLHPAPTGGDRRQRSSASNTPRSSAPSTSRSPCWSPARACCPSWTGSWADEFIHDLRDRGVNLRFGCRVKSARSDGPGHCVIDCEDGREVHADMVLFRRGACRRHRHPRPRRLRPGRRFARPVRSVGPGDLTRPRRRTSTGRRGR